MSTIYAETHSLSERRAECERVRAKYPAMLPVAMAEVGAAKTHAKVSFAALPGTATVAELQAAARAAAGMWGTNALTLSIGSATPSATTTLADLYEHCRSEDGFLHVAYATERHMGLEIAARCCDSSPGLPTGGVTLPPQ